MGTAVVGGIESGSYGKSQRFAQGSLPKIAPHAYLDEKTTEL